MDKDKTEYLISSLFLIPFAILFIIKDALLNAYNLTRGIKQNE